MSWPRATRATRATRAEIPPSKKPVYSKEIFTQISKPNSTSESDPDATSMELSSNQISKENFLDDKMSTSWYEDVYGEMYPEALIITEAVDADYGTTDLDSSFPDTTIGSEEDESSSSTDRPTTGQESFDGATEAATTLLSPETTGGHADYGKDADVQNSGPNASTSSDLQTQQKFNWVPWLVPLAMMMGIAGGGTLCIIINRRSSSSHGLMDSSHDTYGYERDSSVKYAQHI